MTGSLTTECETPLRHKQSPVNVSGKRAQQVVQAFVCELQLSQNKLPLCRSKVTCKCRAHTSRLQWVCGTESHRGQSEHDRSGASVCFSGLPHLLCHQCQGRCDCHAGHAGINTETEPFVLALLGRWLWRVMLMCIFVSVGLLCCYVLLRLLAW